MKRYQKWLYLVLASLATLGLLGAMAGVAAYFYVAPGLPDVETLREVRLQVPLRVYTRDGRLIAEFGEKRRIPVAHDEIPERVVQAFLAAEDDRFFEHPGVDYQGLVRAAFFLVVTGERRQGGGTITMQLARNFFLTPENTYIRKIREIFLALRIEKQLSKEEILTLYLNKIFLGQRSYGVAAAAEVYYDKTLDQLTLAELATIAGLPTAPSRNNPVASPDGAERRKNYVLRRMRELNYIDDQQYQQALAESPRAGLHGARIQVEAPYLAEMVRSDMLAQHGSDAYTAGYEVTTTLDSRLQRAANHAIRRTLLEYDRRHGYRGPVDRVALPEDPAPEDLDQALDAYRAGASLTPGLVVEVLETSARLYLRGVGYVSVGWPGLSWASPYVDENTQGPPPGKAGDVLAPGDVVRLVKLEDGSWQLAQLPEAQGAIVAMDPRDGAISALAGGYDYYLSKYNRAVQARRQPGSAFKPFIYSAALEHGFTAASVVNDAPVVFEDATLEGTWRPENYSGRFFGPTRLREALVRSRNMVSIRLLQAVGIGSALRHVERFGFNRQELPRDLSLALGSANLTPLQLASGYAVLASGGYRTEPYYIQRVQLADGEVLFEADPLVVCEMCETVSPAGPGEAAAPAAPSDDQFTLFSPASGPEAVANQTLAAGTLVDTGAETRLNTGSAPGQAFMRQAPRAIPAQNAYLMYDMMRDVVRRGTGARAYRELQRRDIAGKTGTTNDRRDAWFSGFNADLVTTAWVGFDQERSLGRREEGGRTALPMWIYFMSKALKGTPEHPLRQPPGLVSVRIEPDTGLLASAGDPRAVFETFRSDRLPRSSSRQTQGQDPDQQENSKEPDEDTLF